MQNFFVATADSLKPMFLGFQNPFTALLRNNSKSQPEDRETTRRELLAIAKEVELLQPGLAAELRGFSARA